MDTPRWPPTFVISIRSHRGALFRRRMRALMHAVVHVGGVDGRRLEPARLLERQRIAKVMKRGVLGCFFSHRRIWKLISERGMASAVILEDDATFTTAPLRAHALATAAIAHLAGEWDVLLLGRNPRKRENGPVVHTRLVRTGPFWGLFAYIVSQRGAQRLLAEERVRRPARPVDVVVSQLAEEGKLDVFALVNPEPFTYVRKFPSDTFNLV